jgi:asparagine synthase (glutamine-hydrolysing)
MCGFVCFVNENRLSDKYFNLVKRGEIPTHRGPDNQKFYRDKNFSAYFKRLSIIDLSHNSDQPIISQNKRFVMVFNGEIYNFNEIKKKLIEKKIKFQTLGDSEVLLKSYIFFGENFINHLRGMFSFCIWDKYTNKLIAFRDRFGQKPLFYFKTPKGLILTSEIKDLKKILHFSENHEVVKKFLYRNALDTDDKTFYNNLKRVGPSKKLYFFRNNLKITKYYNINTNNKISYNKNEFLSNFNENIKLHLYSDVKSAFLLSSGLDSTSIVSSANLFKKKIKTFTIDPKSTENETSLINDFVKEQNVDHEIVNVDKKIDDEILKKIIYFQDEPFHATDGIYQYLLIHHIKKQSYKVLFTGDGADEILGGYNRMFIYYMAYLYKENYNKKFQEIIYSRKLNKNKIINDVKKLLNQINSNKHDFENNEVFKYVNKSKLSNLKKIYELKYNKLRNTQGDIFKKTLKNSIFTNDLQMALRMIDRNSMSASIENRAPFLDHKFIDYVFSINTEDFFKNNTTKSMLRYSMKGLNSDKILNQKIKYGRPNNDYYFINKVIFKDYLDQIESSNLKDYDFDIKKIKKLLIKQNSSSINENNKSKKTSNFLFRLYSYIIWSKL